VIANAFKASFGQSDDMQRDRFLRGYDAVSLRENIQDYTLRV